MRIHPLHVSPWIPGVIAGVGFGVVFAVLTSISDLNLWLEALVVAVVTGLLLSVVVGLSVRRMQRQFAPDIAGLPRESATVAYRVAGRGKVPADPEIRAAALRIAERNLASAGRTRLWLTIALACAVPGAVFSVLDSKSWWDAVPAVCAAVGIGFILTIPRRLRRRVQLLRAAA